MGKVRKSKLLIKFTLVLNQNLFFLDIPTT